MALSTENYLHTFYTEVFRKREESNLHSIGLKATKYQWLAAMQEQMLERHLTSCGR